MRVPLAVAALLFAGVAGCLGGNDPEAPGPASVAPPPDEGGLPVTITTDLANGTSKATKSYFVDPTALAYDHALKRFVIEADEDLVLSFDLSGTIAAYSPEPDCFAAALNVAEGALGGGGLFLVHWMYESGYEAHAAVMGGDVSVVEDPFGAYGATSVRYVGQGQIPLFTGERVAIEIGGISPRIFETPAPLSGDEVGFGLNLTVNGTAHAYALPDAPLRCGTGTEGTEGVTAGAYAPFGAEVAVGGSARLETTNASTLVWLEGLTSGQSAATVHFLDEDLGMPAEAARTAQEPGVIGVAFHQWAELLGNTGAWFLADTYWPVIEAAEGPTP